MIFYHNYAKLSRFHVLIIFLLMWTFRVRKSLDLCGFPGAVEKGVVSLPSKNRKSLPGPLQGRKQPLILTRPQSLHQQITHRLGGPNAHRDMSILDTHSRGRIIPPLADRFGIKARIPVAVGLAAFWVLPPPFINPRLGRSAAFGPSVLIAPILITVDLVPN